MSLTDSGDVLAGGIEYATDLFDASTVERMMGYFVTLLNAMVGDRSQRISDLPLLLPRERDQLTVQFNDTRTSYPRNALIQELFEEQAGRTPSAVAVVFEDTQLTYDELNRHANRLARRLQELGVGREVPVAIWMDRSLEMVTSILGILKAGGAYVPLDPTYPAERLLFMIRDTGTPVILTQTRFKNNFPDAVVKMLCLDGDQFAEKEDTNLSGEGRADDLAYVMYTSGSTGTPKGVAITHRNVVRLVKGTSYTSFSPDETFLQLAPLSFDASTFEVWGALLNGGKLVVMPPGQASLEDIGNAINEHGVTTLWLTSGLFNAMVDERVDDLRPLRQLLAGGDVLSVPHVRKALRELTSTRLINGYGPTESTTFACCHTIEPDAALNGSVPIGRPIANTTAYILDAKLHPAPIGVTGQLFLGGDGVGRGYWRRPELTAQKFINDPFASEPDARLYETGDLARWLPDGNIDYLARNDSQVKIRGFRIELQEIDARLRGCAGVQDARVIASEYQERDARLIAYIVPSPECAFRISETPALEIADSLEPEDALAQNSFIRDLRASLAQQMPEFMIPAAFVFLAEIPLMANGKLDRSALPSPDHSMMIRCDYEAPVGDVELVIARIWQELLGVDRVGRHDHFFELGGHSLMVITLIERLRQQGLNTNVRNVFITPTLGVLAASVVKHKSLASSAIVPPNLIPPDFGMTLRETSEEFRI
jgi:aspartate racemase